MFLLPKNLLKVPLHPTEIMKLFIYYDKLMNIYIPIDNCCIICHCDATYSLLHVLNNCWSRKLQWTDYIWAIKTSYGYWETTSNNRKGGYWTEIFWDIKQNKSNFYWLWISYYSLHLPSPNCHRRTSLPLPSGSKLTVLHC
jgi:hypothetical protein